MQNSLMRMGPGKLGTTSSIGDVPRVHLSTVLLQVGCPEVNSAQTAELKGGTRALVRWSPWGDMGVPQKVSVDPLFCTFPAALRIIWASLVDSSFLEQRSCGDLQVIMRA